MLVLSPRLKENLNLLGSFMAKIRGELNEQRANASLSAANPPRLERTNSGTDFVSCCIDYSHIPRV
jgi:hypothetical protein